MQVTKTIVNPTKVTLNVKAIEVDMQPIKTQAIAYFARSVKVPGFRAGHAPANLVEKNIDQKQLQDHFLDTALNKFYQAALAQEDLRPVDSPDVQIKKFVPYTDLEFELSVEIIGNIKLADYKKLKVTKPAVTVTAKDVDEVLAQLRKRAAERKQVKRPAKIGDEVTIDFAGFNEKTEPIKGADGKDYPLLLGSNSFIPGFEDELVGVAPGKDKEFTITFPKDYNAVELRSKKVTFKVSVKTVSELVEAKADDKFASSVGPFKTLAELKADVKKQLTAERTAQADNLFQNQLIETITKASDIGVPEALIENQIIRQETEEKNNLVYRGQTWQEHLDAEGLTEQQHRDKQRPEAEMRVKAGIVLSEIADKEKIDVTPEELEIRIRLLKGQHRDAAMQTELDKPENRSSIASQLMTEKTVAKLVKFATK